MEENTTTHQAEARMAGRSGDQTTNRESGQSSAAAGILLEDEAEVVPVLEVAHQPNCTQVEPCVSGHVMTTRQRCVSYSHSYSHLNSNNGVYLPMW